jgi:nucleoid-associated protein Lsr2
VATRTTVVLVDDIDGGDAAQTVEFALDGVEYVIDVSVKNAKRLRGVMQPWVDAGRRTGGRRRGQRKLTPAVGRGDAAAVRRWAHENGYEVPTRGRIPTDIVRAYDAAKH